MFLRVATLLAVLFLCTSFARADQSLSALIVNELASHYPGARIELTSSLAASLARSVTLLEENARGEAHLRIQATGGSQDLWVAFNAWVPGKLANRRIYPGEKLTPDLFRKSEINIASGLAREYRGTLFPVRESVAGLEARQTVLQDQFLTSPPVQRIPDILPGDWVK